MDSDSDDDVMFIHEVIDVDHAGPSSSVDVKVHVVRGGDDSGRGDMDNVPVTARKESAPASPGKEDQITGRQGNVGGRDDPAANRVIRNFYNGSPGFWFHDDATEGRFTPLV